jgi:propanol-preferring alcohol dehydrogenase
MTAMISNQVSYVHTVTPIPDALDSESAASILCAVCSYSSLLWVRAAEYLMYVTQGLTVYRALKYSETNPGDWIVLPGAGGGLGHLGMNATYIRKLWTLIS